VKSRGNPVSPAALRRKASFVTTKSRELWARPTLTSSEVLGFRMPVVETIQFEPGMNCTVSSPGRLLLPAPAQVVP
jgi:hypothetical protein